MASARWIAVAVLALLGLQVAQARDLGTAVQSTPYDGLFNQVAGHLGACKRRPPPRLFVKLALGVATGFANRPGDPWRVASPSQTKRSRRGDCKDKCAWLYAMIYDGETRFVVGRRTRQSAAMHAWLLWRHRSEWFILDPTESPLPIPVDEVTSDCYLARYSFDGAARFEHNVDSSAGATPARLVAIGR